MFSLEACVFRFAGLFCRFFFSSRRRHTIYWRDWSSDVCSSDLGGGCGPTGRARRSRAPPPPTPSPQGGGDLSEADRPLRNRGHALGPGEIEEPHPLDEIGRASCRERV